MPLALLLIISESCVRPHMDYCDVIYDQHYNNSFHQKLDSVQYNVVLATTGAIRDLSREKIY